MNIRRAATAVACAGLATVGMAAPALADSNGATVTKLDGCEDYGWVSVCGTEQAESNVTHSSDGGASYESNGRYDYTVTFGYGYSFSETGYFNFHDLLKPGEAQVFNDHFSNTSTDVYGTCTYSGELHFANGQWQIDNINLVCS